MISKRERIRAILETIPDHVGKLPDGELDAEEQYEKLTGERSPAIAAPLQEERLT